MIRAAIMLGFWALLMPFAALFGFPWTILTGNISFFIASACGAPRPACGWLGSGWKLSALIEFTRLVLTFSCRTTFSNIDPPIMMPLIPRRTSVMARNELFNYPLLGKAMKLGSLVPVDRKNREAGITAVRAASEVIRVVST